MKSDKLETKWRGESRVTEKVKDSGGMGVNPHGVVLTGASRFSHFISLSRSSTIFALAGSLPTHDRSPYQSCWETFLKVSN